VNGIVAVVEVVYSREVGAGKVGDRLNNAAAVDVVADVADAVADAVVAVADGVHNELRVSSAAEQGCVATSVLVSRTECSRTGLPGSRNVGSGGCDYSSHSTPLPHYPPLRFHHRFHQRPYATAPCYSSSASSRYNPRCSPNSRWNSRSFAVASCSFLRRVSDQGWSEGVGIGCAYDYGCVRPFLLLALPSIHPSLHLLLTAGHTENTEQDFVLA
jgi:hypothetical protein